jgi:molybdopterin converting factor small subunit
MKVLFFAQLSQATGAREIELSVATPLDGRRLWELLKEQYPGLDDVRVPLRIARDGEFVAWEAELRNEHEVAFIPPVSGG